MSDVANVMKGAQKKYGETIGGLGAKHPETPRLPIGVLPFDIASGGGIPLNRMTMVYGPESSGKTNFVLKCIAAYQKAYPDRVCVFIDIEGVLDTGWAKKLGVNVNKLVVIRPSYAEQVVDIVESLLQSEDCGLIALDSIAAMSTMQEISVGTAEKDLPATQSRAVAKLVKRCTSALSEAEKEGYCPTLLWVNQIRFKIGVMFGNPETFPGGQAQRFMAALRVRIAGKNVIDDKVSKVMPVFKRTSGVIQKWKQPICAPNFRYDMCMVPHSGYKAGECADWNVIKQYALTFEWLKKEKGGYTFRGKGPFSTHAELYDWIREKNLKPKITAAVVKELRSDPLKAAGVEK